MRRHREGGVWEPLTKPNPKQHKPDKQRKAKKSHIVTLNDFNAALPRLRDMALDHGITIRLGEIRGGRGVLKSYHVMFETGGVRLLNWWHATGKTLTWDRKSGMAFDCFAALDRAVDVAMELLGVAESLTTITK